VIFEVDDPARMFAGVASSDDPLDADFRAYLRQVLSVTSLSRHRLVRPSPSSSGRAD